MPKRRLFQFLLIALIVLLPLSASQVSQTKAGSTEDSWVSKAPMQVARTGLGVAVVNSKIYAIGGSTASGFMPSVGGPAVLGYIYLGGHVGTNEEYDPATDIWNTKASMPTPRIVFATAVYQNKIYCIGGKTSSGFTGVNEVYDPATDTWETKAPMPTARGWLTAAVVNGKIYLLGGTPNGSINEVYDPATDSWTTKASIPFGGWVEAVVVDDKIYVIGSSRFQIYDPATDTWSQGASPPVGGGYGAVVTTGVFAPKRIYVVPNAVYDPETDSWMATADLPTRRWDYGVAVVNDMLYAIGGHTYAPGMGQFAAVSANEQYTPLGYGTIWPEVAVVSPEKRSYNSSSVSLIFTVDKPALWLGYSLDGEENVTVVGNVTLTDLSNGLHNITVYANDTFENVAASETVNFSVEVPEPKPEPEPFPTTLVIAPIALVAVISVGLLVYLKKRNR